MGHYGKSFDGSQLHLRFIPRQLRNRVHHVLGLGGSNHVVAMVLNGFRFNSQLRGNLLRSESGSDSGHNLGLGEREFSGKVRGPKLRASGQVVMRHGGINDAFGAKLLVDVSAVRLDGPLSDSKALANGLRCQSLSGKLKDFFFSFGQFVTHGGWWYQLQ